VRALVKLIIGPRETCHNLERRCDLLKKGFWFRTRKFVIKDRAQRKQNVRARFIARQYFGQRVQPAPDERSAIEHIGNTGPGP